MRASAASWPKMPVYSMRCCSTASSDIAPVTLTGSTSENQSARVLAMSSMLLAWLRRRAHRGVVPIGAQHLPRCPVFEPDEHLLLVRVGAQLVRERLVNAALAGVRIDRRPDRLEEEGYISHVRPL